MAAIGDLIAFVVVGFVIVAGLSLLTIGAPATPPFARRAATSGTVQLRQDPKPSRARCAGRSSSATAGSARNAEATLTFSTTMCSRWPLGGATTIDNLQLLSGDCNREEGADV